MGPEELRAAWLEFLGGVEDYDDGPEAGHRVEKCIAAWQAERQAADALADRVRRSDSPEVREAAMAYRKVRDGK